MTEPLLVAHDLWVTYDYEPVLRGITLALGPGREPVGVVGPSGAGKTTLVKALLGAVRPSQGSVTFHGKSTSRLRRGDKKQFTGEVRHVSQSGVPTQDPRLTVEKYLAGALKDARRAGRTHATTMDTLLEFVALEGHFVSRRLITLSGGERQRVAMAHALATRPEVLIMDEPLTAIDPGLRSEVLRRLGALTRDLGIGVLLVSHDLEAIDRLCSTVHVLAEGQFVASGELRAILAAPGHSVVADLAEAAPLTAQRLR